MRNALQPMIRFRPPLVTFIRGRLEHGWPLMNQILFVWSRAFL